MPCARNWKVQADPDLTRHLHIRSCQLARIVVTPTHPTSICRQGSFGCLDVGIHRLPQGVQWNDGAGRA